MSATAFRFTPQLLSDLANLSGRLPSLPPVVRYFDDFTNEMQSIRDLSSKNEVKIVLDGLERTISFTAFRPIEAIMKHVVVDWFQRLDPTTVVIKNSNLLRYISRCGVESIAYLVASPPFDARPGGRAAGNSRQRGRQSEWSKARRAQLSSAFTSARTFVFQ